MSATMELLSGGLGTSKNILGGLGATAGSVVAASKSYAKIEQGEMGVRTHFGRAVRRRGPRQGQVIGIVGPGLHPVLPFAHSIKPVNILDRANDLGLLEVDRDEQYTVKSSIVWRVSPEGEGPFRALFVAENLTEGVTNLCLNSLRSVMINIEKADMHNAAAVYGGVNELCEEDLGNYGVELRRLNLHSVARSIGEMLRPRLYSPDNTPQAAIVAGALPDLRAV